MVKIVEELGKIIYYFLKCDCGTEMEFRLTRFKNWPRFFSNVYDYICPNCGNKYESKYRFPQYRAIRMNLNIGGYKSHDHRNQCCEHESINYIASHKKFCCNVCGKVWRGNLCNPSNPLPSDLKDLEEILDSNPAIYKGGNFGEYCP